MCSFFSATGGAENWDSLNSGCSEEVILDSGLVQENRPIAREQAMATGILYIMTMGFQCAKLVEFTSFNALFNLNQIFGGINGIRSM